MISIYHPELKAELFQILEEKVAGGKKRQGDMEQLWHILLSAVKGRDWMPIMLGWRIFFANHHSLIRQIMGGDGFGEGKVFSMQSIKDNVSLLDAPS